MNNVNMLSVVLKCDACAWNEPRELVDCTEKMVGTKCPKCGTVVFDEEDWQNFLALQALVNAANALDVPHGGEQVIVTINTKTGVAGTQKIQ
jgi:hypothetical protein